MPNNETLILTGGSRGIGAAIARRAAGAGYAVCLSYRSERAAANEVVASITEVGGTAIAVKADVSCEEEVRQLFETADTRLGRVSALVNNAGILAPGARVEDMDADRLHRVFTINVIGSFLRAREAVRRMSTRHGGRGGAIVNLSSRAARLGSPNEFVDYAASKAAIDTLTVGLAKEVAGEGIRVNAVAPGLIHTDIHRQSGDVGRLERLSATVPMRRGGQPDEVARAVLWLLSDEASYTMGARLDVSRGGRDGRSPRARQRRIRDWNPVKSGSPLVSPLESSPCSSSSTPTASGPTKD